MFKIPLKNSNEIQSIIDLISDGLGNGLDVTISDILNEIKSGSTSANSSKNEQEHKNVQMPNLKDLFGNMYTANIPNNVNNSSQQNFDQSFDNYEIAESSENIFVYIDIPGVSKDSITLSYEDRFLIVSYDRKPLNPCLSVVKSNIKYGTKNNKIHVKNSPSTVTVSEIKASYVNGILTVTIPKKSKDQVEKIISID